MATNETNSTTTTNNVPSPLYTKIMKTLIDGLSGTAAGMAGKLVEYPLDTVKVRLQTAAPGNAGFKGPVDCLRKTIAKEGFFGLYKGMLSPMIGAMMENAILFSSYGVAQDVLKKDKSFNFPSILASGAFAGVCVSFLLTPVELIKCRLQIQTDSSKYKGPIDCIVKTVRSDGLLGLYKGHTATMPREIVGNAAWFGVYELVCNAMIPAGKERRDLNPLQMMFAGALAGMSYWAVPFPADVVKSRIQTMDPSQAALMADSKGNTNFSSVFRYILKSEGVKGLYRGLGVTLLRAVPANATIFFVYEVVSKFLGST